MSKRQRSLATLLPPKASDSPPSAPEPAAETASAPPAPAPIAAAVAAAPESAPPPLVTVAPDPEPEKTVPQGAPFAIPLAQLAYNPANPRETLGDVSDLADSILEKGQLQAAAVVSRTAFAEANRERTDGFGPDVRYVVIDGNRRMLAVEEAGLNTLNCVVDDSLATSAVEILEAALVANIHRKAFAPLEEARAVQELMDIHGSQDKVAKRLSKSQGWVSQRMALLGLIPELQDAVRAGQLKVEDARKIGRMAPEDQAAAARTAQDHYGVMKPKVKPAKSESSRSMAASDRPAAARPRSEGAGGPGGTIRLGPPADLAASLQQYLSEEDLEKLVELLLTRVSR